MSPPSPRWLSVYWLLAARNSGAVPRLCVCPQLQATFIVLMFPSYFLVGSVTVAGLLGRETSWSVGCGASFLGCSSKLNVSLPSCTARMWCFPGSFFSSCWNAVVFAAALSTAMILARCRSLSLTINSSVLGLIRGGGMLSILKILVGWVRCILPGML